MKIDGEETHIGIKFIYPFFDKKEEISVDLFLSPKFSSHDELLKSLQQMDASKRIMYELIIIFLINYAQYNLYFKVLSECIQVANKIHFTKESVGK